MRIGIDISQIVYEGTGVGSYVRKIVAALLAIDKTNDYILFGSSLRQRQKLIDFYRSVRNPRVTLRIILIPPSILDVLWNTLHILPIEALIGPVDVFWSSDWTQPPLKNARGITTIHDLTVIRYPESFGKTNIVDVQKRRLLWAKKECRHFLCDSDTTKKDITELLGISQEKCTVVYPGYTL